MDVQSTATSPVILHPDAIQRGDAREWLLDFVDRSDKYRADYVDIWNEVLQNYLVTFNDRGGKILFPWNRYGTGSPAHMNAITGRRGGSQLKDPETHQIVETLASQAMGLAFNQRDYVQATPIGLDDPEKARLISRLIMAVLEEPGMFFSNYIAFKDAFIFGTAIVELGWKRCQRMQMTPQGPQPVVYHDMPYLQPVDIFDFYPDPSGTRIQYNMTGCAKRFRISKQQALQLAEYGVYDMAAVQRAIAKGMRTNKDSNKGDLRFPNQKVSVTKDTGMLVGFEGWAEVPYSTLDGASNRVVTLLEDEVVRDSINPFYDGMIPFKEVVINPIAGRFYGLGPAEVIRFLQDAADNKLMVLNDAADLAVRVPLLVGNAFGGNPNQLKNRALFDIIQCQNPEMVQPVPMDLNALQYATADMIRDKMTMREATGATNPAQAIPSGDRQTATEINQLTQSSSLRVQSMVQIYEKDFLPWLGRGIHSRILQFAPPELIATLEGEPFPVSLADINVQADVRFVGSLNAVSNMQQGMAYQQFLAVATPDAIKYYPQVLIRYGRDVLNIKDAELMVRQAQQQMAIDMMMAGMMGAVQQQADAEEEVKKASEGKKKGSAPKSSTPAGMPVK